MIVSLSGWSKLDSVLVGLMALSVVVSAIKGFTRELISLGALVWGFLMAAWFYPGLAESLLPYARTPDVAAFTAFCIILLLAVITGGFISRMAGGMVDRAGMRGLDRLLGATFGLLRGALFAVILVLALTVFPIGKEPLARSRLAPHLIQGARVLATLTPAEMRERFRRGYARLKQLWDTSTIPKS